MLPSRFIRFVTLLLAAIQFAAPAVASVAEGSVAQHAVGAAAHIEEHGQKDCAPPHAADCALCRFLSGTLGHVDMPAMPVSVSVALPVTDARTSIGASADRQGFDARGPPAIAG
jgi:hypothetical protein